MAAHKYVVQQQETVSFYRRGFLNKVVLNSNLKLKDLRVCLLLLTKLNGFRDRKEIEELNLDIVDPMNFSKIDVKQMAESLGLSTSEVEKSISKLRKNGILEKGSNQVVKGGYRFINI